MTEASCKICSESLTGECVTIDDYKIHINCFLCHECLEPFYNGRYFKRDGTLFCEEDYNRLFGERCGQCCETLTGQNVSAIDLKWHLDHFQCQNCYKILANEPFIKRNNRPFCKPCNNSIKQEETNVQREQCHLCAEFIMSNEDSIIHQGKKCHLYHFKCAHCLKVLKPGYRLRDGQYFCQEDFGKEKNQTCFSCRQPITGLSVEAMGKFFHTHHFVCSKCEIPFSGSTFYEYDRQPYCETHYNEKVGTSCNRCGENASGNIVKIGGRNWCDRHFCCTGCDIPLFSLKGVAQADEWDGKPFCQNCFGKLPNDLRKKVNKYQDIERKIKKLQ